MNRSRLTGASNAGASIVGASIAEIRAALSSISLFTCLLTSVALFSFVPRPATAAAERPFKLLTMETADKPSRQGVFGLTEAGFSGNPFFVDTNPLMDLALTPNLGLKVARPLTRDIGLTAGGRLFKFLGAGVVEDYVKRQSPQVTSFQVDFWGFNVYTGGSLDLRGGAQIHVNLQYASASGSQVTSGIVGVSVPFAANWSAAAELGFDVFNGKPRASIGILRHGESFGLRMGMTYVGIHDPLFNLNVLPVVDLYWLLGDAADA